ncbi:hypothetical protein ABIB57_000013 [Devosia sp. UYZn731]|uniref:hypothetical protein n=1 Tax=Devosia sp. UYZn731 TaxID=3156345 RepID=UPI00339B7AD7
MAGAVQRPDGRKKFVVYLDPKLIQSIKMKALEEDRHAYELVEEIIAKSLDQKPD